MSGGDGGPGSAELKNRLVQAAGIVTGVCSTAWIYLFLLGRSFRYGEGLETAAGLVPLGALGVYCYLRRKRARAAPRWFALEFFTASLVTFLVMQLVVVRLL